MMKLQIFKTQILAYQIKLEHWRTKCENLTKISYLGNKQHLTYKLKMMLYKTQLKSWKKGKAKLAKISFQKSIIMHETMKS